MPYDVEFDDVYSTLKSSVEQCLTTHSIQCRRLDEDRSAGRITPRLLEALRDASFCIADLTGLKPNIMWEVGYATALDKPIILITQGNGNLPFDIQDMQTLRYDRSHLIRSLATPVKQLVGDTVARLHALPQTQDPIEILRETNQTLANEIREIKLVVSEIVKSWNPAPYQRPEINRADTLVALEGAWVNLESNSHMYAKIIDGQLLVPYCYAGDLSLTGFDFGWKQTSDFWFARYRWVDRNISGFSFYKLETRDILNGAWWYDREDGSVPEAPIDGSGVSTKWHRKKSANLPDWAAELFEEATKWGYEDLIDRYFPSEGESPQE